MQWVQLLLILSPISLVAVVAAEIHECAPTEGACAVNGNSMLQRAGGRAQQAPNPGRFQVPARHEKVVDGIVKRELLVLSLLVHEGLKAADAVSLFRTFAAEEAEKAAGLGSLSSASPAALALHQKGEATGLLDLVQEQAVPLNEMICHIRQAGPGCLAAGPRLAGDALAVLEAEGRGAGLLAARHGGAVPRATVLFARGGLTDPTLLAALPTHLRAHLRVLVQSGEDEASTREAASEALHRLRRLEDRELLAYTAVDRLGLAERCVGLALDGATLLPSISCVDLLAAAAREAEEQEDEDQDGLLLTKFVRRSAQALLGEAWRLFGAPASTSEERTAERASVLEEYLKSRSV